MAWVRTGCRGIPSESNSLRLIQPASGRGAPGAAAARPPPFHLPVYSNTPTRVHRGCCEVHPVRRADRRAVAANSHARAAWQTPPLARCRFGKRRLFSAQTRTRARLSAVDGTRPRHDVRENAARLESGVRVAQPAPPVPRAVVHLAQRRRKRRVDARHVERRVERAPALSRALGVNPASGEVARGQFGVPVCVCVCVCVRRFECAAYLPQNRQILRCRRSTATAAALTSSRL